MKNKSKKHLILLFCLTTIALSCIDEFTIPKTTATEYETEIVIEGRILAGEESMFHLTYTVPLNSEEEAPDILNAQVYVIGQNGFRSEAAEFNLEKDCYVIDTRALENHRIDWGWKAMMYDINPGDVKPHGTQSLYMPKTLEKEQALEAALYLNEEWDITPQLTTSMGMRYSLFNAFGPRTIHTYREGELPSMLNVTGTETRDGSLKTWHGPEFRLGLRYAFTDNLSVKAGFNTMRQYIHKISNTLVMSPTDTWKLSDIFIKPQTGVQYSLGLYRNLMDRQLEISMEGYFKTMNNYLDYRSGAQLLMNEQLETQLLPTKGRAYGVELLLKKPRGRLNGWIGYTYSRTELRQSDPRIPRPANKGKWYPAEYDKPHDIKLVGNYQFTQRYSASLNVDYSTGRPQTMPVSQYYNETIGATTFVFSERNGVRIPDYFRMDLSFNIKPTHRLDAKAYTFFTIGVYNLTGRKNVYSIYFQNEGEKGMKGYRMSIFGAPIPYASFNVKF